MKSISIRTGLIVFLLAIVVLGFGQATAPKIIVFPDKGWCEKNHYGGTYDVMGTNEFHPDYVTALRQNQDMKDIIGAVEMILKDEGCEIKSLNGVLDQLTANSAYDMVHTSKSGSSLSETSVEKLLSAAQADIIVEVGFEEMKRGPQTAVRFNLAAMDAFTSDPIDKESGVGTPSSNSFDKVNQLQEVVLSFKDIFLSKMMSHFNEMFEKGRKVVIQVYRWDDCPIDFEEEYDGEELGDLIEEWVADNAVSGRYTKGMSTENRIIFDGVRIPMYNKKNKPNNAKQFANELKKYIKELTNQECKVEEKGLGFARVTIGGK